MTYGKYTGLKFEIKVVKPQQTILLGFLSGRLSWSDSSLEMNFFDTAATPSCVVLISCYHSVFFYFFFAFFCHYHY